MTNDRLTQNHVSLGPAVVVLEDQHDAAVLCAFVRARIFLERLARSSAVVDGRRDCGINTLSIHDDACVEPGLPRTADSRYWWSVVKNPPRATLVEA